MNLPRILDFNLLYFELDGFYSVRARVQFKSKLCLNEACSCGDRVEVRHGSRDFTAKQWQTAEQWNNGWLL